MQKIDGALEVASILLPNGILIEASGQDVRLRQGATILVTITPAGVITPGAQGSAYTQTYSTADKTHANLTATGIAQAAATALGDLVATQNTGWGSSTEAGFDSIATQVDVLVLHTTELDLDYERLLVDVTDLKQLVNSVIDDLQALGLVL